jgi:hypothetical protein
MAKIRALMFASYEKKGFFEAKNNYFKNISEKVFVFGT